MANAKRAVAVLVPYRFRNRQFEVFLQKRTADARSQPNMYGLFGGGVEMGESNEAALLREIREELCITLENYEFFGEYEGKTTIHHVFILRVPDDFASSVTVCEGQYGKFYSFEDAASNIPISDTNKRILKDLQLALGKK